SELNSTNTHEDLAFMVNNATDGSINVKKPGFYQLLSVTDSHCVGQVLAPSSFSVIEVLPPDLKIETAPIRAGDCPGEIGIEVIITLTGSPPWILEYSIVYQGKERSFPMQISKS